MKVATKFSLGFALGLLPLVAVLAYIVGQVDRLAAANRSLATAQFGASIRTLQVIRQTELLGEYAGKFVVSGDERYVEKIDETEAEIERVLAALGQLELSPRERAAAAAYAESWSRFRAELGRRMARSGTAPMTEDVLTPILDQLETLRGQGHAMFGATRETIDAQERSAVQVSAYTERMSVLAIGGAISVSLVVFLLTFRAITRPIERLAEGTRAVAAGQFSFQLEERGNDEFTALSQAFNSMIRSVFKLLRVKSDFVSHVSHELKTPLVSMQETTQLVLDGIPGELNAQQRRLIELNLEATKRLASMITDLLELARTGRDLRQELAVCDLAELAERAAAELQARALDADIDLEILFPDTQLPVLCDRDRVIQVLHNLLDNALKHTPGGGTIQVRGGLAGDDVVPAGIRDAVAGGGSDRAFVLLEVDDTGPGLAAAERERVFERFYQASPPPGAGARGGVGLGLAICREIVGAHGGVIWATDSSLGGACFAAVLPRAGAAARDGARAQSGGSARAEVSA